MRKISRGVAVILALAMCFTALCLPAAADREVDFGALAEQGETEPGDGVIILSEPGMYARHIENRFVGKYTTFREAGTDAYGIVDCSGKVYWKTTAVKDLVLTRAEIAVAMTKGWQPFSLNGKLLCPENWYSGGELNAVKDQATGKYEYVIGKYRHFEDGAVIGSPEAIIVDQKGRCLQAEELGAVYNGKIPYRKNGKWGLETLDGTTLLPCEYDDLRLVSADRLIAVKDGSCSILNLQGEVVKSLGDLTVQMVLDHPSETRIIAKNTEFFGVLTADGETAIPFIYDQIHFEYYSMYSTPCYKGYTQGKWHFLGEAGAGFDLTLEGGQWDSAVEPLQNNLFLVANHEAGTCRVMDQTGEVLLTIPYSNYEVRRDGAYFSVIDSEGSGSAYRADLTKLLDFTAARGCAFTKDSITVKKSSAIEFYDLNGSLLRSVENVTGTTFLQYVTLWRGNKVALASTQGELLTDFSFDDEHLVINLFSPLVMLQKDESYYLYNNRGELVYPDAMSEPVAWNYGWEETGSGQYSTFRVGEKYGFLQFRLEGDPLFVDTPASAWYAGAVTFCANAGLMNGTGYGKFDPKKQMTRAMLVQVLYNISGEKTASQGFTDVPDGKWYADAVNWAAAKGIVNGVTATQFRPNAYVTREQMVTILQRYAQLFGEASGDAAALNAFTDAGQISAYAKDAMAWAVENGIITGKTATTLVPKGYATRAEIATVLQRFVTLMAAKQ